MTLWPPYTLQDSVYTVVSWCEVYEIINIWTAVIDESEEWSSQYEYFIYTSHNFTPHGGYELNKLTSFSMCGFIAQLVEHSTGVRGVHGFESRWSPDFFRLLLSNCLNWKILLQWSFLTFIFNRSSNMNYFIYTSHHSAYSCVRLLQV